ncbi:MAG: hypothetical protein VX766_04190 [Pseudomonadota bacterium]|nr:hypothetical protein [Pseudomonadota bacterium]
MNALASTLHTVDDFAAAQEVFHERGWTDGLPVVPPTAEAVQACLDWVLMPPKQLVGVEPVRGRPITAEKIAVNAVMAGCRPEHFPAVVTAWSAMLQPSFLLHGATASTGGCAVLVILNGALRAEVGANSGFSALGGDDRALNVIGRAIRLGLINLLDVRPGEADRATLGHPGKISFCIAEDEENTPWTPLAQQRGIDAGASAVTVMAAMAPRQLMNEWTTEPEDILETYAAEIRANLRHYSIWPGNYLLVVPAQHRAHFDRAGWSKGDVQRYVFERARIKRAEWADVGKGAVVRDRGDSEYAAFEKPEDVLVVAAGGPAGGFGAVIPPWLGNKSRAVTAAVGACIDCEPGVLPGEEGSA